MTEFFCKNCDEILRASWNYCPNCGTKLTTDNIKCPDLEDDNKYWWWDDD